MEIAAGDDTKKAKPATSEFVSIRTGPDRLFRMG